MRRSAAWLAVAAATLMMGCGDDAAPRGQSGGGSPGGATGSSGSASASSTSGSAAGGGAQQGAGDPAALIARGKVVYATNCIACHHRDPSQTGGLGPPVAGSSRELLAARVLGGEYPAGYTPKAETKLMIPLPHLENEIDALFAYLNEAK